MFVNVETHLICLKYIFFFSNALILTALISESIYESILQILFYNLDIEAAVFFCTTTA